MRRYVQITIPVVTDDGAVNGNFLWEELANFVLKYNQQCYLKTTAKLDYSGATVVVLRKEITSI